MSLVKYNFLLIIIFFINVAFSENIDTLKIENFEKLKLKLGLDRQSEFDEDAFNLLMDKEVAKLMNDNFISIKVDREEMPEIDHLYMSICQAMTGRGCLLYTSDAADE